METPLSFWLSPVSQYESLRDFYLEKMKVADPRLDGWPLMSSPLPTLTMVGLYLLFVLIGPHIMKHRKPLNVKIPMLFYNFCMVLLSYYLFHEFLFGMLDANFTFICDPVDYLSNPKALRLVAVCWLCFIIKFIEFMDTIFFILRKKNNQVTFLHIYHHSSMACLWWIWSKWAAGGSTCFAPCINSFIHVVMYSYYFLSGLGPAVQKYLWWKKYITIIQLVQFFVTGGHALCTFVTDCDYPNGLKVVYIVYVLTLIVLFLNFYTKSYTKQTKQTSLLSSSENNGSSVNIDKKYQ